ncbi:hypothetical protein NQZ68_014842 [Dissostichus eleginoides]|nr:hypothetical protein NQZ68_014842 [Dissostichus eleginoides]
MVAEQLGEVVLPEAPECLCAADAQAKQEGTGDRHWGLPTQTHINKPSQCGSSMMTSAAGQGVGEGALVSVNVESVTHTSPACTPRSQQSTQTLARPDDWLTAGCQSMSALWQLKCFSQQSGKRKAQFKKRKNLYQPRKCCSAAEPVHMVRVPSLERHLRTDFLLETTGEEQGSREEREERRGEHVVLPTPEVWVQPPALSTLPPEDFIQRLT